MADKISKKSPTINVDRQVKQLEEIAEILRAKTESSFEEEIKEGASKGISEGFQKALHVIKNNEVDLDEIIDVKKKELQNTVATKTKNAIEEGTEEAESKSSTEIDLGESTVVDNSELTKKVQSGVEDSIETGTKKANKKSSYLRLSNQYDKYQSKIDNLKSKRDDIKLKNNQNFDNLIKSTQEQINSVYKSLNENLINSFEKYAMAVSTGQNQYLNTVTKKKISNNDFIRLNRWAIDSDILKADYLKQKARIKPPTVGKDIEETLLLLTDKEYQNSKKKDLEKKLKVSYAKARENLFSQLMQDLSIDAQDYVSKNVKTASPHKIIDKISENQISKYTQNDELEGLILGTSELSNISLPDLRQLIDLLAKLDSYYKSIGQNMPAKYNNMANSLLNNQMLFNTVNEQIKLAKIGKKSANYQISKIDNNNNIQFEKVDKELDKLRNSVSAFINRELPKVKKALSDNVSDKAILEANDALQKLMNMASDLSLDDKLKKDLYDVQDAIIDIADKRKLDLDQIVDFDSVEKETEKIKENTKAKKENQKVKSKKSEEKDIEEEIASLQKENDILDENTAKKKENSKTEDISANLNTEEEISKLQKLQQELDETRQNLRELQSQAKTKFGIEVTYPDGQSSIEKTYKTLKEAQAAFELNYPGKTRKDGTKHFSKSVAKVVDFDTVSVETHNKIIELERKERDLLKEINQFKKTNTTTQLEKENTELKENTSLLKENSDEHKNNNIISEDTAIQAQNKLQDELKETAQESQNTTNKIVDGIQNVKSETLEMANIIETSLKSAISYNNSDRLLLPNLVTSDININQSAINSQAKNAIKTYLDKKNSISGKDMYEDMIIAINRLEKEEKELEDENNDLINSMKQLKQSASGHYFEDLEILDENSKPKLY